MIRKYYLILFTILFFVSHNLLACTVSFISNPKVKVIARNFDWSGGCGGYVVLHKKGFFKKAYHIPGNKAVKWQSIYNNITFDTHKTIEPVGGINEKGLYIGEFILAETQYHKLDIRDSRKAITTTQWLQYMLDTCSTVNEVINRAIQIQTIALDLKGLEKEKLRFHFFVADSNGENAVIEYLHGDLIVNFGKPLHFPAITNNSYCESKLFFEKNKIQFSKKQGRSYAINSLNRFKTAVLQVNRYANRNNADVIQYAFKSLKETIETKKVETPTLWQIVYDLKRQIIYYRTIYEEKVHVIKFSEVDFKKVNKRKSVLAKMTCKV